MPRTRARLTCILLTLWVGGCGGESRRGVPEPKHSIAHYRNNLKSVGVGCHNYHDVFRALPPSVAFASEDGGPLLSWRLAIAPQLDAPRALEEANTSEPWDSETNRNLLDLMPAVLQSPGVDEPGMTTLMVFTGPGTPHDGLGPIVKGTRRKGPAFRDFTDGAAHTILAVYAAPEKAVPWTKPVDLVFDPEDPLACVGPIPETGLLAVLVNGALVTIPADIDPQVFKNLVMPADGNVVELP